MEKRRTGGSRSEGREGVKAVLGLGFGGASANGGARKPDQRQPTIAGDTSRLLLPANPPGWTLPAVSHLAHCPDTPPRHRLRIAPAAASKTPHASHAAPGHASDLAASTQPFPTQSRRAVMTEQSINVPQVLVFIVVTFLAVRWYFSKPAAAAPGTRAAANRTTPRLNLAQIDQVAEMLPQFSRRDIAWDLQRNGGNVAATTERALSGRGLDAVRGSIENTCLQACSPLTPV